MAGADEVFFHVAGADAADAESRLAPREVSRLAVSFNLMMDALHTNADRLRALTKKAEAANTAKSNFLAGVSHELRTPLNAVLGFSEAVLARIFGPLGDPRYVEYIENIHDSGAHLLSLVEDLMDISRLEIGALDLEDETTLLCDLFHPPLAYARALAAEKGFVYARRPRRERWRYAAMCVGYVKF